MWKLWICENEEEASSDSLKSLESRVFRVIKNSNTCIEERESSCWKMTGDRKGCKNAKVFGKRKEREERENMLYSAIVLPIYAYDKLPAIVPLWSMMKILLLTKPVVRHIIINYDHYYCCCNRWIGMDRRSTFSSNRNCDPRGPTIKRKSAFYCKTKKKKQKKKKIEDESGRVKRKTE